MVNRTKPSRVGSSAGFLFPTLTLLILSHLMGICMSSPHSLFKHYDTLKVQHLLVREKRSPGFGVGHLSVTTVVFTALQRRFKIVLMPGSRVLHPQVTAHLVDGNGTKSPLSTERLKFYTGSLEGEEGDSVDASERDGVWMFHIHTAREFVAVEPMRFYDDTAAATDLIVYSERDIRTDNRTEKPFCAELPQGFKFSDMKIENDLKQSVTTQKIRSEIFVEDGNIKFKPGIETDNKNISALNSHNSYLNASETMRKRRSNRKSAFTECDILSVTEYTFYQGFGKKNPAAIIQTLQHVFSFADRIFRSTHWGPGFNGGYGIVLRGFLIHTNASGRDGPLYNVADDTASMNDRIRAMARVAEFANYCLVHMTVERSFGFKLGIAVGAEVGNWIGGICGGVASTAWVIPANLGLTTVRDITGTSLSLTAYAKVVAHETGHSWGALHDPDISMCAPRSEDGGKYLMWGQLGRDNSPNQNKFSPCSKNTIYKVLRHRARRCFQSKESIKGICGDGVVDPAEDCDPGPQAFDKDPCCRSNCRYHRGAECSFRNSPCCTSSCRVARAGQECYPRGNLVPCFQASHCTGRDAAACPQPRPLPNGSPCGDNGTCWYGRCMSFCEATGRARSPRQDLRPCACESTRREMCMLCCMDYGLVEGRQCKVTGGPLMEGASCLRGVCRRGVCTRDRATRSDAILLVDDEMAGTALIGSSSATFGWSAVISIAACSLGVSAFKYLL